MCVALVLPVLVLLSSTGDGDGCDVLVRGLSSKPGAWADGLMTRLVSPGLRKI